jgi:tetratricopeptide (TPR) repeat protein
MTLSERESGTAKVQEAIAAYRAALEEITREGDPLQWAQTQTSLGSALQRFGAQEIGTARLEEAVAAYCAALEEQMRERVPLEWARTKVHLGNALTKLGDRDIGTARLEEAVAVYRAALEEWTRERVPLNWATTQNNLGIALTSLGEREIATEKLEEALAACRAALEENTREHVPLEWARTQLNLGNALASLGRIMLWFRENYFLSRDEKTACEPFPLAQQWLESGTARLEEAVVAYRAALEEYTRESAPLDWAKAFGNQGVAMMRLAGCTKDATMAKTAVSQIKTAYETMRSGGHSLDADHYKQRLAEALSTFKRLTNA